MNFIKKFFDSIESQRENETKQLFSRIMLHKEQMNLTDEDIIYILSNVIVKTGNKEFFEKYINIK